STTASVNTHLNQPFADLAVADAPCVAPCLPIDDATAVLDPAVAASASAPNRPSRLSSPSAASAGASSWAATCGAWVASNSRRCCSVAPSVVLLIFKKESTNGNTIDISDPTALRSRPVATARLLVTASCCGLILIACSLLPSVTICANWSLVSTVGDKALEV